MIVLVLASGLVQGGAREDAARFQKLGHRMICPCSCNQMLGECNHVGCPDSERMRKQLAAAVAANATDDQILGAFTKEYGTTVVAAPSAAGFDLVAWVMPFAALAAGIGVTFLLVQRWQKNRAEAEIPTPSDADWEALRERVRQETEL